MMFIWHYDKVWSIRDDKSREQNFASNQLIVILSIKSSDRHYRSWSTGISTFLLKDGVSFCQCLISNHGMMWAWVMQSNSAQQTRVIDSAKIVWGACYPCMEFKYSQNIDTSFSDHSFPEQFRGPTGKPKMGILGLGLYLCILQKVEKNNIWATQNILSKPNVFLFCGPCRRMTCVLFSCMRN